MDLAVIALKSKSKIARDCINVFPGLVIYPNFISKEVEYELISKINEQKYNTDFKRHVQHYGYNYGYNTYKLTKTTPIPDWLVEPVKDVKYKPEQIIINRYMPGEGISKHVDVPSLFGDAIFSLSLGSACNIIFENCKNNAIKYEEYLQPRSLLVMKHDARYNYTHAINNRKTDDVGGKRIPRKTRYSITYRTLKK
jgi:alkylated DNA repair dioxygenase AlkB